jgi:delta 1-pyrroline-5-carboxylate dehydrogenase
MVQKMISWKHSYENLSEEYGIAMKKRGALGNLLNTGRISQATYDMFNMEIEEALTEVERRQKALSQKMNAQMVDLEEQIKTLEILLANFEIQHVTDEIDEETYQREVNVLAMGLETSRSELDSIKQAADQLANGNAFIVHDDEPQVTVVEPLEEKLQKPHIEFEGNEASSTKTQKAAEGAEASTSSEPQTESGEKTAA